MRIHFIAIGGSAMHNLAIALHQKGIEVSGSDDYVFEPSASRLRTYGLLPSVMGWQPDRIGDHLNAVILGMHARKDNPELLKAQQLGLRIYSYPEYIYEQAKDKLRVVIGGSHGKTTITSMILHVLNFYQREIDYLVGAQLEGFDTMVKLTDTAPVIIIEGDEYLASAIDRRPKFHLYNANIALISGVSWDHVNVFPTFENYLSQFSTFVDTITPDGELIYCQDDEELVKLVSNKGIILKTGYQMPIHEIDEGITYLEPGHIGLKIFGNHNLLNLAAARQVCTRLGISNEQFNQAIGSFKGAAKRLELIFAAENTQVYKDFAHSPSKLKATVEAVKSQFEERKLVACIELHTFSSLNKQFLLQYHDSMIQADNPIVYIDKKTFEQKNIIPFTESEVRIAFNDTRLTYFDNADTLAQYLLKLNFSHTNLLLMSSGNYGGIDLLKLARELNIKEKNTPKFIKMNIIGKNIRQLRQKNGWSQGEVAKRLNISIPAFSKIETGITDINISRLAQIANLFEVSTMDIISKEGENPQSVNFEEINNLKAKLALREEEIIKLQKKVIDLYEEIREK